MCISKSLTQQLVGFRRIVMMVAMVTSNSDNNDKKKRLLSVHCVSGVVLSAKHYYILLIHFYGVPEVTYLVSSSPQTYRHVSDSTHEVLFCLPDRLYYICKIIYNCIFYI